MVYGVHFQKEMHQGPFRDALEATTLFKSDKVKKKSTIEMIRMNDKY